MILLYRVLFLILLLCPWWLNGQYSNIIHFTVRDGLPSSTTYCTVQDSKGFIWIGTDAGLVRYDGTNFKVFTTADGLPDNEVLGIHFDKKTDRMWVISYCKQACYYRAGKFYTAQNDSSLSIIKCDIGEFINGNVQENVGEFLYNGSAIYECVDNKVIKKNLRRKKSPVLKVQKWADSTYDVLADSEFVEYNKGIITGIYPFHKHSEWCKWFDSLFVRGFYNEFMINGKDEIDNIQHLEFYRKTKYNGYKLKWKFDLPKGRNTSEIILSKDKYILSIWAEGIYSIDTSFKNAMTKIWSGNVSTFYEDKDKNIWICTIDDGVYLLKKQNVRNYSSITGLEHDNLTSIAHDGKDKLYLGNTMGEIFQIENNQLTQIDLKYPHPLEKIRSIITLDNTLVLISNSTILNYNLQKHISFPITAVSGGPKSILKLNDSKTILVGLIGTMISYNIETGNYKETQFLKRIITMAQHPNGTVFGGSLDGLYIYKDDKFNHVQNNTPALQSRITTLCFSQDSILWIGTPSNGIAILKENKIIGYINSNLYISYRGAITRKITAGKPNEIWVATNAGIDRIHYHFKDSIVIDNITPINTMDGLLSNDVNDILVHDSLVYVATSHGLTVLNENQLSAPTAAPVYISAVKINEIDSPIHDAEYKLNYKQNNLQIEYVGVSLQSSGYMRYQYRLLGSSDEWQTTNRTSIDLRSITPGDYTFEVAVLDKFGNRSKHIARIKFHISPAFYVTFWFWGLIFLIVLALGFLIIRNIFRRRQAVYEKEQSYNMKIVELEQQALKAQMNPHFIFNCLTAIQHFVNKEDVYSANMYLSNFAKLIRKTLDLSGEQYITLDKEVSYLENYIQLEKMRFQEKFNYSITVSPDVDIYSTIVPPMLLQPIIENAIRHGLRYKDNNEGFLNIDFNKQQDSVVCKINDNGIGIKKSKELKTNSHVEYQSKGMKLTESRINAINMISQKKITMEVIDKYNAQGIATGTSVLIIFEQ